MKSTFSSLKFLFVGALFCFINSGAQADDVVHDGKKLDLYSSIPVTTFWAMNPSEDLKQYIILNGQYIGPVDNVDKNEVGIAQIEEGYLGLLKPETDGQVHLYIRGPHVQLKEIHHADANILPANVAMLHEKHPAAFVVVEDQSMPTIEQPKAMGTSDTKATEELVAEAVETTDSN